MREILARLRAVISPQALIILVALATMLMGMRADASLPLEARIARTLSAVEGAGRVQVTIRMRDAENTTGLGMAKKTQSIPCGAVAVAQGADDPLVALQLHDALCALLGLAPGAVSVITGG